MRKKRNKCCDLRFGKYFNIVLDPDELEQICQ